MTRFLLPAACLALLFTAGCKSRPPDPLTEPLIARFYLESAPGEAGIQVLLPVSNVSITVNPKPVFVETDIVDAELVRVKLGWCMMVKFTPTAGRDLYRLSVSNSGRRLVLSLNGNAAGARRLDEVMGQSALLIFVEVDDPNLPPLVERLKRTSADIVKRQQ